MRKSAMYLFITMLCWNAFSQMLYSAGIRGTIPNPSMGSGITASTDPQSRLENYDWAVAFSDFVTGVISVLDVMGGAILYGGPRLLLSAGLPGFIVTPLMSIWFVMWFLIFLLNYIGGRDT